MNEVYKSKSQIREESAAALAEFLARGGSVEVVKAKKMRKRTTQKMSGKTSRGFRSGSSGFAVGYSRSTLGVK
jgi:hypothetical protein